MNYLLESLNITIDLISFSNDLILAIGECNLLCSVKATDYYLWFVVVKLESRLILGLGACVELGLVWE